MHQKIMSIHFKWLFNLPAMRFPSRYVIKRNGDSLFGATILSNFCKSFTSGCCIKYSSRSSTTATCTFVFWFSANTEATIKHKTNAIVRAIFNFHKTFVHNEIDLDVSNVVCVGNERSVAFICSERIGGFVCKYLKSKCTTFFHSRKSIRAESANLTLSIKYSIATFASALSNNNSNYDT